MRKESDAVNDVISVSTDELNGHKKQQWREGERATESHKSDTNNK